jgi:hypothetical protein
VVDVGTHAGLLARDAGYRELATAYEQETARRARELADERAAGERLRGEFTGAVDGDLEDADGSLVVADDAGDDAGDGVGDGARHDDGLDVRREARDNQEAAR